MATPLADAGAQNSSFQEDKRLLPNTVLIQGKGLEADHGRPAIWSGAGVPLAKGRSANGT